MNLRSRASTGKNIASCEESSVENITSDSEYVESSDGGEVLSEMINENGEDSSDLNLCLISGSDDDLQDHCQKKEKVAPASKRGRKKEELQKQEQEALLMDMALNPPGMPVPVIEEDAGQNLVDQKKKRIRKRKGKPILLWEIWQEENERWINENISEDAGFDKQSEIMAETAEPPAGLVMPLMRYQKEWLAWALKQEESSVGGGILADEMGMGKTVQAIALVIAKRELRQSVGEPNLSSSPSMSLPAVKGTLIICPVVAVSQWVSEIERFTSKGSNKVLVYHGSNREKNLGQLGQYDFIITTYSTVEVDYRKHVMPPKQKCQWCGKLLYGHKMSIHLKYFCGPEAVRTDKQSKQQRKKSKLKTQLSRQESVCDMDDVSDSEGVTRNIGHKKGKAARKQEYVKNSSATAESQSEGQSVLHSVGWDRIILDEAHYIKDRRCNTTRAVLSLVSLYKWCLSGTPLQNRVGELYSLVRFLEISPYSYYFCKDCDCKVLDYSTTSDCPSCPHKSVRHFCWWNKYVSSPIKYHGGRDWGRRAMVLLKNKILRSIVLRRTKKGRAADLALPPRIVTLRRDSLDIKEEDYYTSLYNESQAQFNTYIEEQTVMNNYAHIFDLLTRLRQAVDHPYLVVYSSTSVSRKGDTSYAENGGQTCGLCHDSAEDVVVTSCSHIFCKTCLIDFSASIGQVSCPTCSQLLTVDFTGNKVTENQNRRSKVDGFRASSILNRIRLDDFQTSTKIEALREEIRYMVERDGSAKGIVFSQFTSFLDLIHYSLQKSGVPCVQLVGSMTMAARDTAIKKFTEDAGCRIFLMSLKAGGVALNLTAASYIFLMDPWWNPAVERQAQDRIHRIGQYKPIRIVRFIIKDTIEERILRLQEKKELVFEGTVGGSSEALAKLTEADLKFLFQS